MSRRRQLILFFTAAVGMGAAGGIHEAIFNNFLKDMFQLSAEARGWLEFPRELPGFLVAALAGVLTGLSITSVGATAAVIFGLGMAGLAGLGESWWPMLAMMVLASAGMHLLQPMSTSVALSLSDSTGRGRRLGQAGAAGTIGSVVATGLVWLLFRSYGSYYRAAFLAAAGLAGAVTWTYLRMALPRPVRPRPKMVFRRAYSLYYLLEFLFGARKQVFLTFGPWVLIQVYGMDAAGLAGVLAIANLIGIAFKPFAGWLIDRFGERNVMVFDGFTLAAVCLGYGYAGRFGLGPQAAQYLAGTCFVLDNLLFALGTSRTVYLARLTDDAEEITSTLAMGVSVNHIASMTIPAAAGAIWVVLGYEHVFAAAAVMAVGVSLISTRVPRRATDALEAGGKAPRAGCGPTGRQESRRRGLTPR